ncbi:probable mitochondrial adenine nucleotide transporter BTL3 isoform X2 [Andrographis paniculata]|uniref:probable mitochondrial adenine nucleotide transporter BTL3 isoform X2 n=1 Tax=Andrographis paniculata TaxID=175694 RepID=UPI0021E71E8D|nr:probable mitochondrial adenine nucleotide transporter BTL3 isoform X2 [Andrographis paniculata]
MLGFEIQFETQSFSSGGLFLDATTIPSSIVSKVSGDVRNYGCELSSSRNRGDFMCLSLSIRGKGGVISNSSQCARSESKAVDGGGGVKLGKAVKLSGKGAVNTTKHLWSGAVAAMVSRTCVAPLERLKLEYIVRGEKRNLHELIYTIATTQGLRGFWKGNFINILRTAPFKAINFFAYDTYRKQLLKLTGNEEATHSERFIAGAAAGMTASVLCLPLDTIRTRLVAPGGEAMGGVIGAFRHVIQNEGFLSLYRGLLPSILRQRRIQYMKQQNQELNALEQLELGPIRTLLHGAIAGACAEAATYPFEVVRRQLQLQGRANKLNAFGICARIVRQGGVPALYAGLFPSLLQVLPSASISFFVYEFMKIVLRVE